MAMLIGGNAMPSSIENHSSGYVFNPFPKVIRDGNNAAVAIGYPEIVWTFAWLTLTEITWWTTTICAGLPSKSFTSASLYNNLDVLTAYSHCTVNYPTYDSREYDDFINVVVRITDIFE